MFFSSILISCKMRLPRSSPARRPVLHSPRENHWVM